MNMYFTQNIPPTSSVYVFPSHYNLAWKSLVKRALFDVFLWFNLYATLDGALHIYYRWSPWYMSRLGLIPVVHPSWVGDKNGDETKVIASSALISTGPYRFFISKLKFEFVFYYMHSNGNGRDSCNLRFGSWTTLLATNWTSRCVLNLKYVSICHFRLSFK